MVGARGAGWPVVDIGTTAARSDELEKVVQGASECSKDAMVAQLQALLAKTVVEGVPPQQKD